MEKEQPHFHVLATDSGRRQAQAGGACVECLSLIPWSPFRQREAGFGGRALSPHPTSV